MTEPPAKPRRRWLQFSLRSLLLVFTIASVWMGTKANRAHKQSRAVEAITKWGGTVSYDYESDGSKQPAYPAWLRNLLPLDYLATARTVRLPKSQVSDDDLQTLTGLPDLVFLDLEDSKITDAGIRKLNVLTKLQTLILNGTDCTDQGVASLKSLTDMRILGLSLTQISDKGLNAVRTMPYLSVLFVSGTRVGDLGLENLRGLKYFNNLDISGTQVTEAGLSQLRQLPELVCLMVSGRLITPAGISELQRFPKLKLLFFERTDDWAKIHSELKQALPGIGVAPYTLPQRPS